MYLKIFKVKIERSGIETVKLRTQTHAPGVKENTTYDIILLENRSRKYTCRCTNKEHKLKLAHSQHGEYMNISGIYQQKKTMATTTETSQIKMTN